MSVCVVVVVVFVLVCKGWAVDVVLYVWCHVVVIVCFECWLYVCVSNVCV